MVTANGIHHNGHVNGKVTYLPCESDYEPRPVIDVQPSAPKPGWRDQHAAFTHHVQWVDAEGISHGLTLRSDSLQDMMRDLRLVKSMIRQAKEQHNNTQPQSDTEETEPTTKLCKQHNVVMKRRTSKHGGHFYSHRCAGGTWCNGRSK